MLSNLPPNITDRDLDEELIDDNLDEDFKLHLEAGLTYLGINGDGDREWQGTNEQWKKYNSLTE